MCLRSGWKHLKLLLGEKFLPILVLSLELFVGGLSSCLLLSEHSDLIFEDAHLISFLHAASHSTFSVLKTFSGFLVL